MGWLNLPRSLWWGQAKATPEPPSLGSPEITTYFSWLPHVLPGLPWPPVPNKPCARELSGQVLLLGALT